MAGRCGFILLRPDFVLPPIQPVLLLGLTVFPVWAAARHYCVKVVAASAATTRITRAMTASIVTIHAKYRAVHRAPVAKMKIDCQVSCRERSYGSTRNAENPTSKKFCGDCGASLAPHSATWLRLFDKELTNAQTHLVKS